MENSRPKSLHYRRSHFATQLPLGYLYSPSHCWIAQEAEGKWRIGLTKFATRMLGEMVDHGFDAELDMPVEPGQIVGWVEGFKAISDLFCIAQGKFAGGNPAIKDKIGLVGKDPYGAGWLYRVLGSPDSKCVDARAYEKVLDKTIDKILEKQKGDDIQ